MGGGGEEGRGEGPLEVVDQSREAAVPVPAFSSARILIIDDEAIVTSSLRRALKRSYEVDVVNDSQRALQQLEAQDYALVLCDLMMPGLSGAELFAQVRRAHPQLAARFVFMTGGVFSAADHAFLDHLEQPLLQKPFRVDDLEALIAARLAH